MITSAFADINWWGVLASTAFFAVLGGLWFTVIIKKAYATALGRAADAPAPTSPLFVAGPLVTSLAIALTNGVLIATLGIEGAGDAIVFGLVVGVGYLTSMTFTIAINPNFPRPLLYGAINAPYFIGASVASSLLLVAIPWG